MNVAELAGMKYVMIKLFTYAAYMICLTEYFTQDYL